MEEWNKAKGIGNAGENAVEMLINSIPNWKCIKFGVENHVETLKKNVRTILNVPTKKIKSMPDFVAVNEKEKEAFFVEVKYKSFVNGKAQYCFGYGQLNEYLDYWKETKLILVVPFDPYFVVVDLGDLNEIKNEKDRKISLQSGKEWLDFWDFEGIDKGIKDLFPDLEDEVIEQAIKLIPSK